ncbi:hypothetical protein [Streptomyces violarus]|uniref:Uncharacterized protein n=1 Tax=Streptomyces violarus TaxID=67380 RepID=A0A7W4ZLV5_9ACTN|nr:MULTISPECIES: hypothetical protein [Streptomyces]MBB3074874.1 hypothetical protein [Streptomyces violarus]WRT97523.1 hypothetical protein VJ737_07440 [Streptomyces sp. CGMCC 4.1772]
MFRAFGAALEKSGFTPTPHHSSTEIDAYMRYHAPLEVYTEESVVKKARLCLLVVACILMAVSCSGSDTAVDTSRLTDREEEWVEFSYAHEKSDEIKRTWEELTAAGVKSYLDKQRPRLCGDTASLMQSLKESGYEAGEMQEYKQKTEELICSPL